MTHTTTARALSALSCLTHHDLEAIGDRWLVDEGDYLGIARIFRTYAMMGVDYMQARSARLVDVDEETAIWSWTARWIAVRQLYRGQWVVRHFHPNRRVVTELVAASRVLERSEPWNLQPDASARAFAFYARAEKRPKPVRDPNYCGSVTITYWRPTDIFVFEPDRVAAKRAH